MKIFLVFCPGWEVEEKLLINCIEMLRIRNVAQAKDKQVCSSATSLRKVHSPFYLFYLEGNKMVVQSLSESVYVKLHYNI